MYTCDIIIVHIILSIALFFIVNWLGLHAISVGYMQMSVVIKEETAPAFNFLFKVLAPPIYIILCAVLFQTLSLDRMNTNIFSIAIYYWTFRLIWVLSTGRGRLINWIEQIVYWSVSISLSLWVYSLIEQVEKILPDPRSLLDQLWILIIVFLYSIFNKVQLGRKGTIKRKNNYITSRYRLFHRKYDYLINGFFHNGFYEALTYSIMIYEDFNRPRVVRWIEYIRFWITKKPHSLGIMQVQTNKYINDETSIRLAVRKICKNGNQFIVQEGAATMTSENYSWAAYYISKQYNSGDYTYGNEVQSIFDIISERFYKDKMPDQVAIIKIKDEE